MSGTLPATGAAYARVHQIRNLSATAYVVRFDRNGLEFEPGRYVSVGLKGDINMREYSIYSSAHADYLEILVKEVAAGYLSRKLRHLAPGDELEVDGPFGFFTLPESPESSRFLFIATGTGISPFHALAETRPDLDYRLLHGVRTASERYEHEAYPSDRVTTCLSRDPNAAGTAPRVVAGRVTDYLREHRVEPDTLCYLCGNCDMIYEAFDILKTHGVPPEQLYAEVYF
ncbi:MAG: ferredoxin--NADP reductase [Spirochaetales bacterium]